MRWVFLSCAGLLIGAAAYAQPGGRSQGRYQAEAETPFESNLTRSAAKQDALHADIRAEPAGNNARGLALSGVDAVVVGLSVTGRKYGVSLDDTGDVLIKNFVFRDRRAKDVFGAGLILGQKAPTRGETWLSNAWIDLQGKGPIPDYKLANNEAIAVEAGSGRLNVRRAVLIGGEESGLDNKGDVWMDASFVASGHRSIRIWRGARVVIANSIVLAHPDFTGLWFGGGEGEARFEYFNCLFGRVGDSREDLSRDPPDWMVHRDEDDPVRIRMRRLDDDPFDRGRGSFWAPTEAPIPPGYLKGHK